MDFLIILLIISLILLILSAAYGIINYVIYSKSFYRSTDFIVLTDVYNKTYYIDKDTIMDFDFKKNDKGNFEITVSSNSMFCNNIEVYASALFKFIKDVQK